MKFLKHTQLCLATNSNSTETPNHNETNYSKYKEYHDAGNYSTDSIDLTTIIVMVQIEFIENTIIIIVQIDTIGNTISVRIQKRIAWVAQNQ